MRVCGCGIGELGCGLLIMITSTDLTLGEGIRGGRLFICCFFFFCKRGSASGKSLDEIAVLNNCEFFKLYIYRYIGKQMLFFTLADTCWLRNRITCNFVSVLASFLITDLICQQLRWKLFYLFFENKRWQWY